MKAAAVLVLCAGLLASAPAAENNPASLAARDTIAQINHLNWVVSKIKTYNNVLVLQEEYRQISPDKLNLNRIPNKETLGKIIAMLDLLHEMVGEERDLSEWKRVFESRRKRKQSDFWQAQAANAGDAITQTGLTDFVLPSANAVFSLSRSALTAYREYDRMLEDLEDEALRKKFEMETKKLNRLHELNKDLLQSQWKMIQDYGFDDSLRVSDTDITLFIAALKDDDHARVYSKIEAMQSKFKIFPLYWYYLSSVALETGHRDEAMAACDMFFKVNRGLFRDDPTIGAVAMTKAFLLEKNEENRDEVRRLLELVWLHNAGEVDWRKDYFCASVYATYLKDAATAKKVLLHAISALESSLSDQLHLLVKDAESKPDNIDFADGDSLWMCRKLMGQIASGSAEYDAEGLKALCAKETTSSIDKLDYVGKMSAPRLWEVVGPDVEQISVETKNRISWKGVDNEVTATLPIRWLLSGGISARLELLNDDGGAKSFPERRARRALTKDRQVQISFDVPRGDLAACGAVRLSFLHPDYPIALTYASGLPYSGTGKAMAPGLIVNDANFNAGKTAEGLRLMIATFKGKEYCRDAGSQAFSDTARPEGWMTAFAAAFPNIKPYAHGLHPVGTNGVAAVRIAEDGAIRIQYRNETQEKIRPAVSVYLLNKYGAIVSRVDDSWNIKRLKPGEEAESKPFPAPAHAAYFDIETTR